MSEFPGKMFTVTSTGHTYEYIRIKATSLFKSEIVFFHGFPAIASGWRHQIKHFADEGYGIIAPDLLGYGGSSKPEATAEYRMRLMVEDMMAILEHERIEKFHGIGHDAGTYLMSRLYNYHSERLLSMTFIAVPYNVPGTRFDVDAVNQLTKKLIGFEKFAYIQFLASDRSPDLIDRHLASFQSIAYHSNVTTKADNFYPPDALEAWLQTDRNDGPEQLLQDASEAAAWFSAFQAGGLRGPTNWYRVMTTDLNEADEKNALAASQLTTKISVPVLAIGSQSDKSTVPGFLEGPMKPHTDRLAVQTVQSQGHYPHIVSKEEVNRFLRDFVFGVDTLRDLAVQREAGEVARILN